MCSYTKNVRCYISNLTSPHVTKPDMVAANDKGPTPAKSPESLIK